MNQLLLGNHKHKRLHLKLKLDERGFEQKMMKRIKLVLKKF